METYYADWDIIDGDKKPCYHSRPYLNVVDIDHNEAFGEKPEMYEPIDF
jgi:hypothetical protein